MIGRQCFSWAMVCLFAMQLAVGCSSSSSKASGGKVFEGYQRTQTRLDAAEKQVDTVLADMGQLTYTGPIKTPFDNYKKSVDKLEEQGKDAKWRSETMTANAEQYISNWQKDVETVNDPTVKASLEARREAVRTNFGRIRAAADDVRKAYDPFMADHQAIVKALSIDTSSAAVPGLKPVMSRATANGKVLKDKLGVLRAELNKLQTGAT
jgi:hypothetical protein